MTIPRPEPLPRSRLDDAVGLARSIGWPDGLDEWKVLAETARILAVRDEDGRLAAMGALSDFGAVCVVGKMIVREDRRGRGLGRLLLRRLLREVTPGAIVALSATEQGKPLYEKLGFREVDIVHIHRGSIETAAGSSMARAIDDADLGVVWALDRGASGCERAKLLEARRALAHAEVVRLGDDGFGMVTRHGAISLLGPVVANDESSAEAIVRALAAGRPLARLDSFGSQPSWRRALARLGLVDGGTRALMTLDGRALPGDRSRLFSLAGQAYG